MSNTVMKGLKIIEMGTHVAIPYCASKFEDREIEPPKGESYRYIGRLFHLPFIKDDNYSFTPYKLPATMSRHEKTNSCVRPEQPPVPS